ncbi:MAG: Na+/H+ antiporter [Comamonas sp.]
MESISIALAMMLAVVASGVIVRMLPVPIPLPLVQIGLGALIAGGFNRGVQLEPEIFFLLFLPPLLFLDGWRIPKEGLLRDKYAIIELALGLVVCTVVGVGYFIHWMIPAMPLPVAFALAAIVSPTDPVAVSAITSRVRIPTRVMHVLEGESLLNDASGLVAFRFAVLAAVSGSFSLASAALSFFWVAGAGLATGALFTLAITWVKLRLSRRYGEESGSQVLVSLLIPFGAYELAEHIGASGILAAVAAGITMSYAELSGTTVAATRVQRAVVWNTVQFTLNGVMFVLLGEQLPSILRGAVRVATETGHQNPWWLAVYAVAICAALVLLRFSWVWVSLAIGRIVARRRGHVAPEVHPRLIAAISLAGVRGAITLAGVMTLPLTLGDGSPFPARDLAIFLAATVIILSLVGASVFLPRLLKNLDIPLESAHHHYEDIALQASREAALRGVERTLHQLVKTHPENDPQIYTSVATEVMQSLTPRTQDTDGQPIEAEVMRELETIEREMRLGAISEARTELFRLARENKIPDDVCRDFVARYDLQEARLR